MQLGKVGIWSFQLRFGDPGEVAEAAAELDELGYGALWVPDVGGDVFADLARLLDTTTRAVVATGILNVWTHSVEETVTGHATLTAKHPGRLLLGLGVSHAAVVERVVGRAYEKPIAVMRSYLDGLDEGTPPVPKEERALAALGPQMLRLAATRTAGAHPYLVSPQHTVFARATLGVGPLLMPEQKVVLSTDSGRAREIARKAIAVYLGLPNYTNNLRRIGFADDDLADGGSDRLVDAIVAWGDLDAVRARVNEHLDAGADHVCLQVLREESAGLPRAEWRELATAVLH